MTKAAPTFLLTGVSPGPGHAMSAQPMANGAKPIGIGRHFMPEQQQNTKSGTVRALVFDAATTSGARDILSSWLAR